MLRPLCGRYESNYFASVLFLGLRTAPFYGITHIVEYQDRDGRDALPLVGTKRFVGDALRGHVDLNQGTSAASGPQRTLPKHGRLPRITSPNAGGVDASLFGR